MTIEAVVFDFGGVIVPGSPVADAATSPYAPYEERFGLAPGAIWNAMYLDNPTWMKLRVGEGTADLWHASIHEALLRLTDAETAQLLLSQLTERRPAEFNQGIIELLKELRPSYHVGLLSNAAPGLEDELRDHYRVYDLFHDVINSATVGLAKPDPRIYALAASRLEVPIERCFFTDDLPHNVEAARSAGMTAHVFDNAPGLRTAMAQAGVTLSSTLEPATDN